MLKLKTTAAVAVVRPNFYAYKQQLGFIAPHISFETIVLTSIVPNQESKKTLLSLFYRNKIQNRPGSSGLAFAF